MVLKNTVEFKNAATNSMLVANAFVWYLLAFNILRSLLDQKNAVDNEALIVIGVNAIAIVISALIGSIISERITKRGPFLRLWLFAGIFISLIPIGLSVSNSEYLTITSILLGAYFGLGMPATMGYYSEHVGVENRGKISGITFLIIGLVFAILGVFSIGSILIACLILSAVKIAGFGVFFVNKDKIQISQEKQKISFVRIAQYRSFILYFAPWCMFNLINYMTVPIVDKLFVNQATYEFLSKVVESIIIALSAVTVGILSDKLGRKRFVIVGFVMLGFGYASLGLFNADLSSYIYIFADGVAWGTFSAIFLLTLWGDIADNRRSDKFYFIGALPYILSNFMRILLQPYLSQIPPTAIFSFGSIFLFLAVLPLIYAPETVPEKVLKDRDLNSYVSKAIDKVRKEMKEEPKTNVNLNFYEEPSSERKSEETKEDEEARRLAEKYY